MIRKSAVALAASTMLLAMPAAAWGPTGHRITGQIAENNISGRTRAAIATILGAEGLPEASTWPDEERSNPDPFWQSEAGPFHYVTLPQGQEAHALVHPAEGDALTALEAFSATVRDENAPVADRALALRFIIHIVGDLHMPLHAGNGTDRGGNDVRVTWFGAPSNLHSVWDSGMIAGQDLSFTEYADRLEDHMTGAQVVAWWDADPATWITESAALRDTIYPAMGPEEGLGTSESPVRLQYQYQWTWLPTVDQRLSQAGIRLAAYLDALFAD